MNKQLYIRDFRFLWHASRSDNCIVKACMNNAKYSSNSCIGYKLSVFRNPFYLDMDSDFKLSVVRLSVNRLDLTQQVTLDNILSLLNVRTGAREIEIFSLNQVNTMINYY